MLCGTGSIKPPGFSRERRGGGVRSSPRAMASLDLPAAPHEFRRKSVQDLAATSESSVRFRYPQFQPGMEVRQWNTIQI
jgi:hypothetical protein